MSSTAACGSNRSFQREMEAMPFTIFEPLADLGYYGWRPQGPHKSLKLASTKELIHWMEPNVSPERVFSEDEINRLLPMQFATLAPQETTSIYPYSQYDIVSLHVAFKHRGVDKDSVNFYFGGSSLEVLATQTIPFDTQYLTTKVPGTDIIMMVRYKEYIQDYSNVGFQVERLVTGKAFEESHKDCFAEHLQLMKVAGYQVMFSAESDAADSDGNPVEIKASNPFYWGTKTMFQMISNGSSNLYLGHKGYGILESIRVYALRTVAATALAAVDVHGIETNIRNGLDSLRREAVAGRFVDGSIYTVTFHNKSLQLAPFSGGNHSILPSDKVVAEMLSLA